MKHVKLQQKQNVHTNKI